MVEAVAEIKARYDVLVVGGGVAGISAAVAAARNGASVLLIEKGVNLGGLATVGLISWYEPLCDGHGKQLIGGIAEELIRLATECGFDNLPSKWGGRSQNSPRNERFSSFYSPTFFSMALDKFLLDNGVKLLFDTLATYPIMNGKHCEGVIVENANGREIYEASVVIDATGDASIMHRAGVPCTLGENFLTYVVHEFDESSAKEYVASGDLSKFRRWKNCGSDYMGNGHPAGMKTFRGDTAEGITDFVIKGKLRMLDKYADTDKNSREIMMLPSMPQFRTVRHINGQCAFAGKNQKLTEDCIGYVGDFREAGKAYPFPFSCTYNSDFDNLLAAGRIVDVSDADAWEIARVIPVCALSGEAVGIAAAMASSKGRSISEVSEYTVKTMNKFPR